jgi:LuxR family maltose regulon positive regulatory protein
MARWYKGHLAETQAMLSSARSAGYTSGDTYAGLTASIFLNRIQLAWGKLHQAAATFEEIIRQGLPLAIGALAYYDLGWLHYEWNELETAAAWIADGNKLGSRDDGCDELRAAGLATLAIVRQAQGRASAAREALQLAAQKLQHSECSPAGRLHCLTARILVALAQGDVNAAALAAEEVPSPQDAHTIPDYLPLGRAQARALLAQGKRAAAAQQLEGLYETASGLGWNVYLPQVRAVQALAAATPDQALELLAGALTLAEPEGYVRTFLDLGEPMAVLLDQALARNIAPVYVRRLLRAFAAASQPRQDNLAISLTGLVEGLTQREIEVLRLLAGSLTNQEIAEKLYVSENTVKTHLANIYGKLGARDRREAITRARSAGLLA